MTIYVSPEKYPFYFHKGRLCEHSSFFEQAFHGSFDKATTGSIYLADDGVDEFKVVEEWLYSEHFNFPGDHGDPSLLLVKLFCFADKVGISKLQNASLDAIRNRAMEQHISQSISSPFYERYKPQSCFGSQPQTLFHPTKDDEFRGLEESVTNYVLPITSHAIHYAYENSLEYSPLRKLLADIFAFNVKPEMLREDILLLPHEFVADVLSINMKRLPFRLGEEEADFDNNANKYHVPDSLGVATDRNERVLEDVEVGNTKSDVNSGNGPVPEAAIPDLEASTEPVADDKDAIWGFGASSKSSRRKKGEKRKA